MARPTEYTPEVINSVRSYLDECIDEQYQLIKSDGDKSTTFDNKLKVRLPTIEGLAVYLKIHRDTIYAWEKEHEEFSDIIAELRFKQAEALINNGLSGDYNSTIAKVLLTKHGYRDEIKQEQSGGISIKYQDPGDYIYPSQDQSNSGIPESI
jgi:hypothetical protein